MNKICITLLTLLAVAGTNIASAKSLQLKMYRGEADTVYTDTHTVIGVTDPKAKVTINGTPVKVYSTGSFGTKLNLTEGRNNTVLIIAENGGETVTKTFSIYRPKGKAPVKSTEKEPELEAKDFYATSLPGAFMQFGCSDDRLGGAKMGFVDEGILYHVVGEAGFLYKVQLSQNRYAYMEKKYLKSVSDTTSVVNTGSWTVKNIGKSDRVTISLPTRLPYYSYTSLDPTTIYVELYGATNNSNWITQAKDLKIIDYVDYRQDESDVFKVIIKLKEKYAWGYSVSYSGSALSIDVRHCPSSLKLKDLTIGLDAGHGGKYLGAVSPSGLLEKDINLDIIKNVCNILQKKGTKVVMTRSTDVALEMSDRKKIWKDANVDIALSVHNNSGGSPFSTMGTSAYYRQIVNRELAMSIHDAVLELGVENFGLVGNFNFSLNGPTDYPNMLVEGLFMSSLEEEELLADAKFRKKMAEKIVQGLERYLEKVSKSRKEKE